MQPGIVVYADLRHQPAAQFQLADQFDADGSAGGTEVNLVQQLATNQTVVAVDVADPNAEEQARAEIVDVADPDAVSRVVALQLVAVDQPGLRRYELEQAGQLADIVLAVAIRIENKFPGGSGEARTERAAIPPVFRVCFDAHAGREVAAQLVERCARAAPRCSARSRPTAPAPTPRPTALTAAATI